MTETALTPQQTFEESIKVRIKKDIGELIPDEILRQMFHRSLEEVFFKERIEKNRWGGNEVIPSLMHELVVEDFKTQVTERIKKYFDENEQVIFEKISTEIVNLAPAMIANFLMSAINKKSTDAGYNLEKNIKNFLESRNIM